MKRLVSVLCITFLVLCGFGCSTASPKSQRGEVLARERDAQDALMRLYSSTPGAQELANGAKAILVFPEITKAGLMIGGQFGKGVLFKNGRPVGYYNSRAASYGLQAGIQKFGYALFFMSDRDLDYLDSSDGWEIGVGPSITVVDTGMAKSFTTTTSRKGVYAFFFEQRGLMAGIGIQGTKITKTSDAD